MLRMAVLCLALSLGLLPSPARGCGDPNRVRYEPRTFLGYACEDDCERHKSGFAWAERHRVTAVPSCAALGATEAQGCRAYVEEATSVEEAGYRWAGENEIEHQCDCDGAGQRFRAGCLWGIRPPPNTYWATGKFDLPRLWTAPRFQGVCTDRGCIPAPGIAAWGAIDAPTEIRQPSAGVNGGHARRGPTTREKGR